MYGSYFKHVARTLQNPCIFLCRAQASVAKLQDLQAMNAELHREVDDTKRANTDLTWAKERLNREMDKLREELSNAKEHLTLAEGGRLKAVEEVRSMHQLLAKTREEGVRGHMCVCGGGSLIS